MFILGFTVLGVSACSSQRAGHHVPRDGYMDTGLGKGIVPARLVVEPQDGSRPLVRAIDKAQHRVFMEAYILTDQRVVHALERAVAQDVAVYVLLEHHPFGMGPQPERMADGLRAAGVAVRWTRSEFQFTHAKFVVLDDRIALVSSANFSRSAFQRNRDFLVFDDEAQDARALSRLFRADWNRTPATVRDANVLIAPGNARHKLLALVRSARRQVDVYAEEIADADMQAALAGESRRRVTVRVILPWGGSPSAAAALQRNGVQVRQLRAPYVHAKVISVDGREAFVGSENLSTTSLDRNREVGVLIRGRDVGRLGHLFEADWKRASPST